MTGQTYYTLMEDAMEEARRTAIETCLPPDLTYDQMKTVIVNITDLLKMSLSDGERIALTAKRHTLRLRLQRVEEVAQRLLGTRKDDPLGDYFGKDINHV